MTQDFSNQRLRGQSFRGQDLAGANFSRADIRGADFRGANLTGANFSQVRAGLTPLRQGLSLLLLVGLAVTTGGLAYLLQVLMGYLTAPETQLATRSLPLLSLLGLLCFLTLLLLRKGLAGFNKLVFSVGVVLVILVSMILGGQPVWGGALAMVALVLFGAALYSQAVAVLVASGELVQGALAGCGIGAIACVSAIAATRIFQGAGTDESMGWMALLPVFLGIGLAWRALGEDERYRPIQQLAVALVALGGTRFRHATATDADFSQAHLGGSDWRRATLLRTRWTGSHHLERAWFGPSILRSPSVRRLLVTGQGRQQSWAEAELHGAYLAGADLTGADLRDADLSQATLQGALLEQADLTRAHAIGTDFRAARMTAARLDQWDIDASTRLEEVDCRYVYLGDRTPAQGDWQPGDFTRAVAVAGADTASVFDATGPDLTLDPAINPEEILASLLVLVRLATADNQLEAAERTLLDEALKALQLPPEMTLERLLDERASLDTLLAKINSPIIREKVYQSAYLMARIDGELELAEEALLDRIQTRLGLSPGKVEKLQTLVTEAQTLSIAEQVQAITDPAAREAAVNTNIRLMSLMHAFSGAMPIPGFALVTHLMIYKDQVELVQKIARIWGYPPDYDSPALTQTLFGTLGATAARVALSNVVLLIPGWGSVISASTAFSMTWAIGELTQQYFATGGDMDTATLEEKFALTKSLGQQRFQESQAAIAAHQQAVTALLQDLHTQLRNGTLNPQDYLCQFRAQLGKLIQ
jgi:uncharacterized protein YjbI with pentapeptide repeats/uncharacterized protein (DUF697 family)